MKPENKTSSIKMEETSSPAQVQDNSTAELAVDGEKGQEKEFDPFEHRDFAHPTSTIGAFFHLLKSSLGSGLLAMPFAFKNIGLIPGAIGTVLVAVITTHCVHILVSTSRDVCRISRVPVLNYTDTCEKVFAHGPQRLRRYSAAMRNFADYAMAGVCLGGTGVYVIFIAKTLNKVLQDSFLENNPTVSGYCGILLIPLILFTQIRYLKFLVPFSMIANLSLFATFCITCYYTFTDMPEHTEAELYVSATKWPIFVSTAIFAMEGINVVMPVENEMARPQHFLGCPSVLNVTMGFVAVLYGIVGIFGYIKYGNGIQEAITLNLPQKETPALIATVLVTIAVFFTYCLQMYAPMDIIWTRIDKKIPQKYKNIGQITLRTLSVTLTVSLAVLIPDLGVLMGLVGAIFFSTLGLLIPAVVQTVHNWERGLGRYNYLLYKNGFLVVVYLIVLVSGCYASVSEIKQKFFS